MPGKTETRFFIPGNGKTEWFRDHADGPEMVVGTAGEFMMGSPDDEPGRDDNESPRHKVAIRRPFAVGRFAITFDEWDTAVAARGVSHKPDAPWGRGRQPVVNVSWNHAQGYVAWLSKATGKRYHLLSEAEWEYVCRAGTTTPFWWGKTITPAQANYLGDVVYAGGASESANRKATLSVDYTQEDFKPNPWGLHQTHGNVWEWCADGWDFNYENAPRGALARETGDCRARVVRGGYSSLDPPRAAYRNWNFTENRIDTVGLRVARVLPRTL